MDSADLTELRKRLRRLRDELESVAASGDESARVVELDQSRVGRLSRMDALQLQEMAKASGTRRIESLRKIDLALKRIDLDDYGYCQTCGEEIHRKRLEFDPTASQCIDCAEKAERQ